MYCLKIMVEGPGESSAVLVNVSQYSGEMAELCELLAQTFEPKQTMPGAVAKLRLLATRVKKMALRRAA